MPGENLTEIWNKAKEILKDETTVISYETYIQTLELKSIDNNVVLLVATNPYQKDAAENRYRDLITNTFNFITNKKCTIKIVEKSELESIEIPSEVKKDVINNKLILNSGLKKEYTFETFVVGNNNKFAQAAAMGVCENPGSKYNPFFIYGGVGLGKTHLMQAIGNAMYKQNPNLKMIYATGELFANELVSAIMTDKNESFRKKYRNIDLLLIDDIQFLAGKEKCQEEFFHTFNTLFESGKQIVLTSEKPPKEIPQLEDRLKTRFEMGLSVDIQAPDYETRLAILRKKAEKERYIINDEILVRIATKVKSNIRELEGVFNKLIAYTSFTNNKLTNDVVDNTIESILVKNTKVLTSKLIMQVVCKFFNIKVNDIVSDKRSNNVAYPRQIAMYLCREVANMSFPSIGKDFGGRDHSTVLHAYSKIKDEYETKSETKDLIEDIKKALSIAD